MDKKVYNHLMKLAKTEIKEWQKLQKQGDVEIKRWELFIKLLKNKL